MRPDAVPGIVGVMTQPSSTDRDGPPAVRLLVATADPGLRAWVRSSVPAHVEVCATAGRRSVVMAMASAQRADVCLLDLRLPGGALAAVRDLVGAEPAVRVLAWGATADEPDLLHAIEDGATGCIVGDPDGAALARALADVLADRPSVPRALVARLVAHLRPPASDEPSHRSGA